MFQYYYIYFKNIFWLETNFEFGKFEVVICDYVIYNQIFLMFVVGGDVNVNGMVVLNFFYFLDISSDLCRKNVFMLIYNDVLRIVNNICIKNVELYLGYEIQVNVTQVRDWVKQGIDCFCTGGMVFIKL